jgi:hypothetical protein
MGKRVYFLQHFLEERIHSIRTISLPMDASSHGFAKCSDLDRNETPGNHFEVSFDLTIRTYNHNRRVLYLDA